MILSRKEELALLITAEIYLNSKAGFLSLSDISAKHDISLLFLKKIASMLKKSDILISKEGVNGGYKLALSPRSISVWDICQSVTESKTADQYRKIKTKTCPLNKCLPQTISSKVFSLIETDLKHINLLNIINDKNKNSQLD